MNTYLCQGINHQTIKKGRYLWTIFNIKKGLLGEMKMIFLTIGTWSPRRFPTYLLLYLFFIFYLSRCTLTNFPSVSSLASLPFLSCYHRTTYVELCNFFQILWSTFVLGIIWRVETFLVILWRSAFFIV